MSGHTASSQAPTPRRLAYRAGLDGVRALAVAGVVLYHAQVSWVPGGFMGVDVFFVLSGYLITSLLLVERSSTGGVNLGRFWMRRARRLLPAVLLVVFLCLIAASMIARDDLGRTRGDAWASLVYLNNWHQIIASESYFNAFGRPSLLRHLWSLAVEEQFYLLWPLLLLGGLKLVGRTRTALLAAAAAAGSVALMWALYKSGDPSRVYYGTDTRASTLLVGCLLAFVWPAAKLRSDIPARAVRLLDALGVAGLLAVIALFWRVHDYDPGLYHGGLLLAALCAAALIAAVAHPASRLGVALGWRPLRWVGIRSYGIYLWHWPVMMLTRPRQDLPWHGVLAVVGQVAITLALAGVSYRYVEQPVRTGEALRKVRAWLDRRPPHRRLQVASGTFAGVAVLAGLVFGLPAPADTASASSKLSTAAARVRDPKPIRAPEGGQPNGHGTGGGGKSGSTSKSTGGDGLGLGPGGSNGRQAGSGSAAGGSVSQEGAAGGQGSGGGTPGGPILAAGDSVMLGCEPELEEVLGPGLRVDAVVGRQTAQTAERLKLYRTRGALPATVVVQVGDNGPLWYSELEHLRTVLRGVETVVLVNVRLERSWQDEVNDELSLVVPNWSQARLANWYGHSNQGMLTDGVHPDPPGCVVYAKVIAEALQG